VVYSLGEKPFDVFAESFLQVAQRIGVRRDLLGLLAVA